MAFYAGQLVREPAMENPTIVVITDRNDLDDQLFGTFSMCRDLIRQTPVQADSREDLQKALSRASGGAIFTTIQKFAPEKGEAYPMLTDRRNVVVIADEAHRSQYGFKSRIEKTGEIAYPNRRIVDWLGHFPRNDFSQSALNEIGSAVTLFRVKRHAAEFLSKISTDFGADRITTLESPEYTPDDMQDDDAATLSVSRQAEETTEDFIVRRIMAGLTGYQFEELVAHVMECMGYTARVTPRSGDGGVDVIAHMNALGFQPPIVKIQCKRTTGQHSNAEVNQLLGMLGDGEFGLFVTLGSFSRAASELERSRPKLRLIDGDSFVDLLLDNYAKLSPRYRSIVPLKQIYVPDLPTG
ncbi:Type III restriction enzyme, res subunit [Loktanella atrilutea]|uniref:Type III restriction enzyme, res subunit n=1 Tax=Loktanella atrilutea TaxID=366533 RepID=A0A1M5AMP9_LOKAT|nr:restriction endonuclease [Loktanella atrilutea]SHF31541.1 Type III restriction enzyme, res subunit [Loktanella atrilutea]